MALEVTVLSDPDFENLVAEVVLDDEFFGVTVTQNEGPEDFEVVLFHKERRSRRMKLQELESAIGSAKARLEELGWKRD